MFRKLSVKLTAGIIFILIAVTVLCVPMYMQFERDLYISQEIDKMETFYEKLVEIPFSEKKSINKINSLNENYKYNIRIMNSDLKLVYVNTKRIGENTLVNKYTENAVPDYVKTANLEGVLLRKLNIQNGERYCILVFRSVKVTDSVFAYTDRNMILILLFYMIICSVALPVLVNRKIQPIRQISEVTKRIAEKDYSVRYEGKVTKDEIGLLVNNINKMADTIEENVNSLNNYNFLLKEDINYMTEYENVRKMVISNITHELKTPLAIISSQVEMMNCTVDENKKQFYYNSALEEIEKMSTLIRNLLNYSITEHDIFAGEIKEINVSRLIKDLCEKRKRHIMSGNFVFETDIQENCVIPINENHIIHIFNNYISNAMNHTVSGGKISVKLKKIEDKIRFSVYNDGSQIADENKDKIWTKFFTSNQKPENDSDIHAGLGLFIVKEISVLERTKCGFENLKNGVNFWFDFNCNN